MTQLTALERDLLACVERLVTVSEAYATDLTALKTRSTGRIETQLTGLADCMTLAQHAGSGNGDTRRGRLV